MHTIHESMQLVHVQIVEGLKSVDTIKSREINVSPAFSIVLSVIVGSQPYSLCTHVNTGQICGLIFSYFVIII